MVSASKILTVSYGTFSCTLEGFEEPFSTMKAIAEYFRDLAADDRYFGAEPPTPDAEMLHRIAEREIKRRVDAKINTNSVVLRASDASESPSPAIPRPAALSVVPTPQKMSAAPAARIAEEDLDQDAVAARSTGSTEAFPQDSVAAKLLRIRAAVSHGSGLTPASDPHTEAEAARAAEAARIEDEAEEQRAAEAARAEAEAEEQRAAEAARAEAEAEEQRAAEAARIEAEEEEQRAAEAARAEAEAEEQRAAEAARIEAEEEEQRAAEAAEDETDQALRARVLKISRASQVDESLDDDEEDDEPFAPAIPDRDLFEDESQEENKSSVLVLTATADAKANLDAALADAQDNLSDQEPAETPLGSSDKPAGWQRETSLSEQDEAELLKELAEVEFDSTDTHNSDFGEGRSLLNKATQPDEVAMSRLMKQAETELAEPESRRRHSAIEHLRAAVAATRAQRKDTDQADEAPAPNRIDRFREDLAKVVRPRRPVAGNTSRPTATRPLMPLERGVPLMLVSEQRVDKPGTAPRTVQPVRPRRINTSNLALDDDLDDDSLDDTTRDNNLMASETSFADFAARIGATDLGDLLEAAACYCAQIEGRESFSRPQILRKLTELPEQADLSREEGMRSFGLLLREGRISKVRRGQFAVQEGSRFLPEARRISQG